MELKEYLKIIKDNGKIFFTIVATAVIGSFLYVYMRPANYDVFLTLNITRNGIQQTADYRYDDFYRLQADEKFAETIVEWLKNPQLVTEIYDDAKIFDGEMSIRQLSGIFRVEKRSAQVVTVAFSQSNPETAKALSQAIIRKISQNTEKLNIEQKEPAWFEISAFDPAIILHQTNPFYLFAFAFLVGLFIAFWVVLIIHYLK